ncbi:MAG: alpha/beta fold hydrolase [Cocleimonas sp.]
MKINMLKVIRTITAVLEKTSPALANKLAIKLFFSPRASKQKLPEIPDLQQHWCEYLKTDGSTSKCRVYTAGTGPTVLLVHGWEGSAFSMSAIAKQLLEQGLRVVLFDLPAHGFSPGKKTNIIEVSEIIQLLTAQENDLLAIVSHSFGSVCAGHAIKSGIKPKHFISIGAPTSMDFIFDSFCNTIGASEKIKKELINSVEDILKTPYETESLTNVAKQFNMNGLIIHDRNDRIVPYEQANELLKSWAGSKLFTTEKLGHNRMLKNKDVIEMIMQKLLPA